LDNGQTEGDVPDVADGVPLARLPGGKPVLCQVEGDAGPPTSSARVLTLTIGATLRASDRISISTRSGSWATPSTRWIFVRRISSTWAGTAVRPLVTG
jgi:hypothetical protein